MTRSIFSTALIVLLISGFWSCQKDDQPQDTPIEIPAPGNASGGVDIYGDGSIDQIFEIESITGRRTTNGGISFVIKAPDNLELVCYFPTLRDTGFYSWSGLSSSTFFIDGAWRNSAWDNFTIHVTSYDPSAVYPILSAEVTCNASVNPYGQIDVVATVENMPILPSSRENSGVDVYYQGKLYEGEIEILKELNFEMISVRYGDNWLCASKAFGIVNSESFFGSIAQNSFSYPNRSFNSGDNSLSGRIVQTREMLSLDSFFIRDIEIIFKEIPCTNIPDPEPGTCLYLEGIGSDVSIITDITASFDIDPRIGGTLPGNRTIEGYWSERISPNYYFGYSKLLQFLPSGISVETGGLGDFSVNTASNTASCTMLHWGCGQISANPTFIKGRDVPL